MYQIIPNYSCSLRSKLWIFRILLFVDTRWKFKTRLQKIHI